MRVLLILLLTVASALAQLPKGGSGSGGGGAAPFVCSVIAQSSVACVHNLGTSQPFVACYDGANASVAFTTSATSANIATLLFTGSTTATCVISVGTGPIGPVGPAGPTGATGQGFNWRAAYSAFNTYAAYDVVSYAGSAYVAIGASSVGSPATPGGAPSKWQLLTQQGGTGPQGIQGAAGPTGAGFTDNGTTLTVTPGRSVAIGTTVLCSAIGTNTGTTYTLSAANNGCVLTFSNAGAITLTVPAGLPVGFSVLIVQLGAGAVTPTASSTTINQRQSLTATAGQYAVATLSGYVADVYILAGDLQ